MNYASTLHERNSSLCVANPDHIAGINVQGSQRIGGQTMGNRVVLEVDAVVAVLSPGGGEPDIAGPILRNIIDLGLR